MKRTRQQKQDELEQETPHKILKENTNQIISTLEPSPNQETVELDNENEYTQNEDGNAAQEKSSRSTRSKKKKQYEGEKLLKLSKKEKAKKKKQSQITFKPHQFKPNGETSPQNQESPHHQLTQQQDIQDNIQELNEQETSIDKKNPTTKTTTKQKGKKQNKQNKQVKQNKQPKQTKQEEAEELITINQQKFTYKMKNIYPGHNKSTKKQPNETEKEVKREEEEEEEEVGEEDEEKNQYLETILDFSGEELNRRRIKPHKVGEASPYTLDHKERGTCSCRKTGCLKSYCECFKNNMRCSLKCHCLGCKNIEGHPALLELMGGTKQYKPTKLHQFNQSVMFRQAQPTNRRLFKDYVTHESIRDYAKNMITAVAKEEAQFSQEWHALYQTRQKPFYPTPQTQEKRGGLSLLCDEKEKIPKVTEETVVPQHLVTDASSMAHHQYEESLQRSIGQTILIQLKSQLNQYLTQIGPKMEDD